MKILTMVWSIGIGGTERAAVNYAIGYRLNGVDSRVLVLGEGKDRLNDLLKAGVKTSFLKFAGAGPASVLNTFKLWEPNIIHLHNFTPSFTPFIEAIKSSHTKVVETNVFSRPNYHPAYKAVSLSMQLSRWGYWKYANWMKGAKYTPQSVVVPYVVYQEKFPPASKERVQHFLETQGIPQGAFVAGRLGQPHPSKWDSRLLKVIKATIKPNNNIYYLFVGMPENLKAALKNMPAFIQNRVKQIDVIQGDDGLSLYYHSLNCFVHISKIGESFGYVLAEALMCSVPVITMLTPFKDNAQLEVVGHNYGGICVVNTQSFINAIMHLYNEPAECKRIKENLGKGWIPDRFSAATIIPNQINYYKQLLRNEKIAGINVDDGLRNCFGLYCLPKEIGFTALRVFNQRFTFYLLQLLKRII